MPPKQVPLHQIHCRLKAKMGPFAGHTLPLQYGSVAEEVGAVRMGAGLFDVSHMGEFFIRGRDAVALVDYIITNDFLSVPVGKAVYSPLCNEKGQLLDDLIAYKISENEALLCVNSANRHRDWAWIEGHTGGFVVDMEDASDGLSLLALQGPKSLELLSSLLEIGGMGPYEVREMAQGMHKMIVATTGYTGEKGLEIFCPSEGVGRLWEDLLEGGAIPCGLIARDILRLEACFPLYGCELTEEMTPFDVGLGRTVKGQKNDFLGKKALERIRPKFTLLKLSLEKGIPRRGYPILNARGHEVGEVTSGIYSPTLKKGIALARLERDKQGDRGEALFVGIRGRPHRAHVHERAFISSP